MILLGVDPGYRHMGVVLVETFNEEKPRVIRRTTLQNGSIKKWQEGLPQLLAKLSSVVDSGPARCDAAGVEMISWYGKRRGSLQLAHLAGACVGLLLGKGISPVRFFVPKEVKATSAKFGAPKGFDEHQTDALSICRLLVNLT